MSRQVNLYEAKAQLSRLVDDAAKGETIVIAKNGLAMAKLTPLSSGKRQPRQLGQLAARAGKVDWTQWWRDWKAADKEIEADFETSVRKSFPKPRSAKRH
jgi:prevent-host-death family protein